ncbi:MAG: VanW family protein [Oscillospiraceae bacterium]|nr:VanW family protein [Oscillospiraceae bacterium]
MPRKLFCELGPAAYRISLCKVRMLRRMRNLLLCRDKIAHTINCTALPVRVYAHKSLIRRTLGEVDMQLQENKAHNLAIAAPRIHGIIIRPGETFSFWSLVGYCSTRKGYREGLTISSGKAIAGVGGGLCQFTNLVHWLALHSPLDITEHHHHDGVDLFPDFGRQVPFGCGTSIHYNNLDYRLTNNTNQAFQLLAWVSDTHLHGELRCETPLPLRWHIAETESYFSRVNGKLYRVNKIERRTVEARTGNTMQREIIRQSNARVMYDESHIPPDKIR